MFGKLSAHSDKSGQVPECGGTVFTLPVYSGVQTGTIMQHRFILKLTKYHDFEARDEDLFAARVIPLFFLSVRDFMTILFSFLHYLLTSLSQTP